MIRTLCLAAALAVAVPSSASAYWGYWGYGWGSPWGGYGTLYPTTDYVPAPPYFSIYPPVYYSHQITARHYGASPYAWLPGMSPMTYAAPAAPMPIANPHAKARPADKSQPIARSQKPQSRVIDNPYVRHAGQRPHHVVNPHVAQADR